MKRPLLALLAVALVGVTLFGCGTATAIGGADDREPSKEIKKSGDPYDDRAVGPEPPVSTLSYGGEAVRAGLGTYCWTSACVDKVGISLGKEPLSVPANSTLTFVYGGKKLESLSVTAHPIGQGNHLKRIAGEIFLVPDDWNKGYKEIELPVRRSGNRARIATDLCAGEYAIAAFTRMPQGDALYGFRVFVK